MEQYGTIWNNHGFWLWPIPNCICAGRCCDSIRGTASSDPKSLLEFPSLQLGPKMCMLFGLCCIYLRMELLSFIMGRCFVCRGITVSSFNSIKFQPVTPFCKDFRNIIHNCDLRNAQAYQASSLGCRSQPITSWSHNSPWSFWQNSQITGSFDMFKSSNFLGRSKHRPASQKTIIKPSIYYRKL